MNKMRTTIIALICCYLGSGCTTQLDATVTSTAAAIADPNALAVLVPGSGSYSRPISTRCLAHNVSSIKAYGCLGGSTSQKPLPPTKKRRG